MKIEIPKPIVFNPYKHHYYFINEQIQFWKKKPDEKETAEILKISDNMLDLYFGKLSVNQICNECLLSLESQEYLKQEDFLQWLKPSGYKKTELSDGSRWLFREGENPERYVHIHPAKDSIHSTRVRGTTLKTVVAMQLKLFDKLEKHVPSLAEVNQMRVNILNLSPVKKLEPGKGILKLWHLFNQS